MKKLLTKTRAYFKETFTDLTWREAGAASLRTGKDVLTNWREALTLLAFCTVMPPGSMLIYMTYRLRMHRAHTGKIDAKPDALLSDERLKSFWQAVRKAPGAALRALWSATPVAMKTAGTAVALSGTALSTYGALQAFRNPVILNYSLLDECNKATARKQTCSAAGAAEKAKSQQAMTNLGMFMGGGVGVGAGAMMFAAPRRRKK